MKFAGERLRLSASDIANFVACQHRTRLDLLAARGALRRVREFDLGFQDLVTRGEAHELTVLERFRADGRSITEMSRRPDADAEAAQATLEAIRSGTDVIYQGVLLGASPDGGAALLGRPDFLVRADLLGAPDGEPRPGELHYEVVDAKLARTAKARAVAQTAFYSHLLAALQGVPPRWMHLALGRGNLVALKVGDYAAYERQARRALGTFIAADPGHNPPTDPYPEPVEHCVICRWDDLCKDRRRRDDDLSLVAGITKDQRRTLKTAGVSTRRGLASLDVLPGGNAVRRPSLEGARLQARLQVASEEEGRIRYEILAPERDVAGALLINRGLLALPEPASGDLFFDIEGARYYSEDGQEFGLQYLFGVVEDDCRATLALRDWLEQRRADLALRLGEDLPRPAAAEEPESTEDPEVTRIRSALLAGLPADSSERTGEQKAKALLADLLDWHRREAKPAWWRYFQVRTLSAPELVDEPDALGGLTGGDVVGQVKRSVVRRFSFPPQEYKFTRGDTAVDPASNRSFLVWGVDDEHGTIDLKAGQAYAGPWPAALVEDSPVNTKVLAERLRDLGDRVVREGVTGQDAGTALLLRLRPDEGSGRSGPLRGDGEPVTEAAVRLVLALRGSYLPIQGPPGTGKTFTAAGQILELVKAGRTVGITGPSHAVIHNLLGKVVSHPPGAGVSALEHILGDHATVPPDAGLLLDQTWRMHPRLCRFTSETFYDGKLSYAQGLERQEILGDVALRGSGLRVVEVAHEGNTNASPEEAAEVARLVRGLVGRQWQDKDGARRAIGADEVLVVAPYNAHIRAIEEALARAGCPGGVRVGTVDKFQGREAPVAIYSMATSSADDAPRGLEFLYDLHRLNVATSRARAMAVVVASADLIRVSCRTPRQMHLANALCRAWEGGSGQRLPSRSRARGEPVPGLISRLWSRRAEGGRRPAVPPSSLRRWRPQRA